MQRRIASRNILYAPMWLMLLLVAAIGFSRGFQVQEASLATSIKAAQNAASVKNHSVHVAEESQARPPASLAGSVKTARHSAPVKSRQAAEKTQARRPTIAELVDGVLAVLSREGDGPTPDEVSFATAVLMNAAQEGNAKALRQLGDIYREGKVVETDLERAMRYYEKADQLGHLGATAALGSMLAETDPERAVAYLERAVGAVDNPGALYTLGNLYRDKAGPHHLQKAREYYARAAALDNEWAHLALGDMALTGQVGAQDVEEAQRHYERARDLGSQRALRSLGSLYASSSPLSDPRKAAAYYRRAAEAGDAPAAFALGRIHRRENLGDRDRNDAIALLEEFATGSNEAAARKLIGDLYRVEQNPESQELARQNYRRAAELGDGWAMLALGDMTPSDSQSTGSAAAEELYQRAAQLGVARAHVRLGDSVWRLGDQQREVLALRHYTQAEEAGDSLASLRIARAEQSDFRDQSAIENAARRYRAAFDSFGAEEVTRHLASGSRNGLIAIAQSLLTAEGFDVGPVDGLHGPKTIQAIQSFCRARAIGGCERGLNGSLVAEMLISEPQSSAPTQPGQLAEGPVR
jgi:TPR repeat protein